MGSDVPDDPLQRSLLGCSGDLVSLLHNRPYRACYGGLEGMLTGLTKSTDHPSGHPNKAWQLQVQVGSPCPASKSLHDMRLPISEARCGTWTTHTLFEKLEEPGIRGRVNNIDYAFMRVSINGAPHNEPIHAFWPLL